MRYGPVFINDKFGRDVELRNAEVSDAAEMIKYLKTICGETPYVIIDPDEINLTLEQEQNILQNKVDSDDELLLVALVEGKHVGNCSLMSFGDLRRYRHRCSVAIALYQEYCGLGIGRQMMDTVLRVQMRMQLPCTRAWDLLSTEHIPTVISSLTVHMAIPIG